MPLAKWETVSGQFALTPRDVEIAVAAVAERFLEPGARDRVNALLSADDDTLTAGMSPAARPGLTNIGIRIGTPRSSAMRPLNNGTSSTPNSTIRTRIRLASKRIRNSDC